MTKVYKEFHTEDEFMEFALSKENKVTEEKYRSFYVISTAKSLQSLARELRGPTKINEEITKPISGDSSSAKIVATPVLFALATELALKALYCQETKKKEPPHTHDLAKLFDELEENTQAQLEEIFKELGENTQARPEIMSLKSPSGIRDVLHQNKDVFKDWRYPFEHPFLVCFTRELDEATSAIIETYYKLSK